MGKNERNSINYYLRPAKSIERRLLGEIFRKLESFKPLNEYRYIGFGAKFFVDFVLYHKELGIQDMISIEGNINKNEKYEFNKPYSCIDLKFGKSSDILIQIDLNKECLLWLDYDELFNKYMLDDIKYICSRVLSGSMVLMTCNKSYSRDNIEQIENRFEKFKEDFGKYVPIDAKKKDITAKKFHKLIKKMVDNIIKEALLERNCGIQDEEDKYEYKELIYFTYKDGAPMVTIGGVIIQNKDMDKLEQCRFNNLFFTSINNDPYDIIAPNFTYKELQFINEQLPCCDISKIKLPPGIEEKHVEKFLEVYRYFPYYMESRSVV